jgi:hypothetical protein
MNQFATVTDKLGNDLAWSEGAVKKYTIQPVHCQQVLD